MKFNGTGENIRAIAEINHNDSGRDERVALSVVNDGNKIRLYEREVNCDWEMTDTIFPCDTWREDLEHRYSDPVWGFVWL
jgi:hypothetical protein